MEIVVPELENYQRLLVNKLRELPIVLEIRSNIAIQTLKAGAPLALSNLEGPAFDERRLHPKDHAL